MDVKQFGALATALLLFAAGPVAADAKARLADAVEKMDRPRIRALLEQRVDVNAPQVDGMTALHWAAYKDEFETAKLLVDAGAEVKAKNRYGVTALSPACMNGNSEIVELLLEAGADPNTTLRGGETALMTAARTGKLGPVKALLSRGADVDARERQGQTAVMWAAADGHGEIVDALIKAGADFRTPQGLRIRRSKKTCGEKAHAIEHTDPARSVWRNHWLFLPTVQYGSCLLLPIGIVRPGLAPRSGGGILQPKKSSRVVLDRFVRVIRGTGAGRAAFVGIATSGLCLQASILNAAPVLRRGEASADPVLAGRRINAVSQGICPETYAALSPPCGGTSR